jgi:hypothetical protein
VPQLVSDPEQGDRIGPRICRQSGCARQRDGQSAHALEDPCPRLSLRSADCHAEMPKSNAALTLAPLHETVSIHTRWSEGVNARFFPD